MKKILAILLILALLIGCQHTENKKKSNEDLPPTPPMPGGGATVGIGRAILGAIPPWAVQARRMEIDPAEVFVGKPVTLRLYEYDYIYKDAYVFNQKTHQWEKISLFGAKRKGDWIQGTAATSINAETNKFRLGENYVVAYACNKISGRWNCNDNKWMLNGFTMKEEPKKATAPKQGIASDYVIAESIRPFNFQTTKAEPDNFEEVMVMRYDAQYYEPRTKLKVLVHVFEFNNAEEMSKALVLFKDIINKGWQNYKGQNVALYLDVDNVRNTIWTSGNKLIFIATYNPAFASAEITDKYLQKYPSDLRRAQE